MVTTPLTDTVRTTSTTQRDATLVGYSGAADAAVGTWCEVAMPSGPDA
jgi:hypothetical protein